MKSYKPVGDRLLIEVEKVEKTASGIIMPDLSNDAIKSGKVIAVGNGLYSNSGVKIPMEVSVGDTVTFQIGMGAQKVKLDGNDYYICREPELLLIISE